MPAPVDPRVRGTDALGRPLPRHPAAPAAGAQGASPSAADVPAAGALPIDAGNSGEHPAGLQRRAAAWCVDLLLLTPLLALLVRGPLQRGVHAGFALFDALQAWMLQSMLSAASAGGRQSVLGLAHAAMSDPVLRQSLETEAASMQSALFSALLRSVGVLAAYFIAFEASTWAATPGKRLLKLRVADMAAAPPGLQRAALRFAAGGLSWLTLNIGHLMAGLRRDHRALHDLVAGTQVLGRGAPPPWARALLFAMVLLVLFSPLLVALVAFTRLA